ncbi:MAG: GMC oxidoreductase [Microbacterium sp.]|uniref:GMC oxidoreductase n=1 Tax=Microbacterium sp. TaxID=51671 RepID=UPI003F823C30
MNKRFDVVVVGSGASGSIAVKELTERGLEVLLLEAGRDITEADFAPTPPRPPKPMGVGILPRGRAALRGQPIQARRAFYSDKTTPFLVNDIQNPYRSSGEDFLWIRGRQLGGRLNAYGRVLLRMSDYDFAGGATVHGDATPWPITYADVEPWYDRIEEFLGLYGNEDRIAVLPDGKYRGGSNLSRMESDFAAKVEERWPGRRSVAWRFAAPNLGRIPMGVAAAKLTSRLTIRTDSVVRRVDVDDSTGRATGVTFVDRRTKREHSVHADVVMLCASTIESLRIMLNSGGTRHPDGLANSSGLLGHYFMDQTPGLVFGSNPAFRGSERDLGAPPDEYYGPSGGVYLPMIEDDHTPTRFVGGYAVQGVMGRMPLPDDAPSAFGMMSFGEMLPARENRVTLDRWVKDAWRMPAPRIHVSFSENERALLREQVRGVREMVEYTGGQVSFAGSSLGLDSKKVFPDADPLSRLVFRMAFKKSLALGAAIHECGGARMGGDPATSVLNSYNQAWDVPNLFVTDASSYVTNGIVGPTLTIMALTARTAEYIAREHATGEITRGQSRQW